MLQTQTMCRPSSWQNTTKTKSSKANFVTWTFRLSPKRQLSILFNVFFPFIDIRYFLSSLKLWHCRTIVLLNKFKLVKKPIFQKWRWSCYFPPRKTLVAQKHRAISRQEKMTFSSSCRVAFGPPFPLCTYGRTDADVRAKISRIDRLPDLLTHNASLGRFARRSFANNTPS